MSVSGALAVGLTLGADFARGYPIVSFMAACMIAAILYAMWVRAGRPGGVARAEQAAEAEEAADGAGTEHRQPPVGRPLEQRNQP